MRLDATGRRDWLILDAADEVGGTWRDNVYPGVACDVPSHVYSYSFAPWDWSEAYAGGAEIQEYLVSLSHSRGLRDRIRFGQRVQCVRWIEAERAWEIRCDSGDVVFADAVIGAIGGLREPKYPDIPGRERFAGVSAHSARWPRDLPLDGKRVGVIGTAASAIQLVPGIVDRVGPLTVFQRTPSWIMPRDNRPYSRRRRWAYQHVPGLRRLHRARLYFRNELTWVAFGPLKDQLGGVAAKWAHRHLERHVDDPELREKLRPTYDLGCKRVLVDDNYYAALSQPNATLETRRIEAITPTGVTLADGEEIPLDVIVYATGFEIERPLGHLELIGRNGVNMAEAWGRRPRAYYGATMPNFPNFFMMVGPNAGLGHNSIVFIIESELRYVLSALELIRDRGLTLDLAPASMAAWLAEIDRRSATSVWESGCRSWYLNSAGENFTLWPGSTLEYAWRTRRFDPAAYRLG